MIVDLVLGAKSENIPQRERIERAMQSIQEYETQLTQYLLDELTAIESVIVYGPKDATRRTSTVAFNIAGQNPMGVARHLDKMKIETRAGCHCATLAHYYLGINPPASCRISPYFYNTMEEMRYIVEAIRKISSKPTPKRARKLGEAYKTVKAWVKHKRHLR